MLVLLELGLLHKIIYLKVFITESPAVTGKTLLALGDGNSVHANLNSDGSATFDGSVESKNNFFVKAQANDQTCFRVTDSSGSTIRTNLRGDGGAEFASTVKIGNPSNPEIQLTGSGAGTFAGTVNTGVWLNNSSTSLGGGAYMVRQDSGTSVVWKAFSGGTGADHVTSQIKVRRICHVCWRSN